MQIKPVNIYFVRHGETLLNTLGKMQGWIDSPLTMKGIENAEKLGEKLSEVPFSYIAASDAKRARQSAGYIMQKNMEFDGKVIPDPRFREWGYGSLEAAAESEFLDLMRMEFEGEVSFQLLNSDLPKVCAAIKKHDRTGFTEEFSRIEERLKTGIDDIISHTGSEKEIRNALVVTHAFLIKTLIYLFAPEQLSEIKKIENAAVTRLCWDGTSFHMMEINEILTD